MRILTDRQDVDEAIAYINARPHPLALYLCCKSSKIQKQGMRAVSYHAAQLQG